MKILKNEKVGFDFDKVFVNYPPLIPDELIEWLYKIKNHKLRYRYPSKTEQKIRILSHYPIFRHPSKKNIASLKDIWKNNKDIYLISSRFSFLDKRTYYWTKRYGIEKFFKKMYFNFNDEQPHIFKNKVIKKEGIKKFVDDDLDLLRYLSKENPKVEFYWLSNKKPQKELPNSIKIVKNLEEFKNNYL